MSLKDALFWFFLGLFGTGTYVIFEQHVVWGSALILVGIMGMVGSVWDRLKDPMTGTVQLTGSLLKRIKDSRLLRTAAKRLIVAYIAIYALLYVHQIRSDLDTYTMPRQLTKAQTRNLEALLRQRQPFPLTVQAATHDSEALNYAGQIFGAFKQAGWDDTEMNTTETEVSGQMNTLNDGLCIDETGMNSLSRDPKHDPERLLQDAFRSAHIEVNCGGGGGGGDLKVFVLVGHRPLRIGQQQSQYLKFLHWLERLGR